MNRKLMEMPVPFKNFGGNETEFNKIGDRNCTIAIYNIELAEDLIDEGWHLRPFEDEDGNLDGYYMGIKINFKSPYPPRVFTVSSSTGKRVQLGLETVECLDSLQIEFINVEINPYEWSVGGIINGN